MEITLMELLDAREERARHQVLLLKKHPCSLICFTMNIAGPRKTSPLIERAFRYGLSCLDEALSRYTVLIKEEEYKKCGPVAYYSVDADPVTIKDICTSIEESCPLGRLFDMDVLYGGTKLERRSQRNCIVCGKEGRYCAAGRLHSVEELQKTTTDIITDHFKKRDSEFIAFLARDSLINEVTTTPKPGLVDSMNSGSHTDMDHNTFLKSAEALLPYFKKAVLLGIENYDAPAHDTFLKLRAAGIEGEKDMYRATGGINTHKGIIYSLGVVLCAIGRLWKSHELKFKLDDILNECAALVNISVEDDFSHIDASTAGGRFYLTHGKRGIRGEVAEGLPSVKNISLPIYRRALSEGISYNDAGVWALIHLIANIYDTNLYSRGGEYGVKFARDYARKLLSVNTTDLSQIEMMDAEFIKRNLSPGGSADLLAITYFFADLEALNIIQ